MSTALYRRYRPETFEEVVGQEHVTVPLMAALEGDRTNHAYLFSGPRGCGKTTSARILARCLNCAEGPTATPCGECESCVELSRNGSGSLDVVEMDAASHGGVEDARDLRERAGFAPLRDRYKVFIIDEAHMVSPQGFNALLKLVEEPPPHVKFIFATTEPEKVIGTIRSRTHHYPFRLVPPGILEDYMADMCRQENVEIAEGVLPLVVRAGTGSVRDSLSVLDQLIGGAGEDGVSYQTAVSLLGYTDGALLDAAVDAIASVDGGALFTAAANVVESGLDPRRFVEDLLERLRDLVVISLAGESAKAVLAAVPEDQLDRMKHQADQLGAGRASRCADLTNTALSEMMGATSPRLQLELLCARLLLASSTVQTSGGAPAPVASVEDARAAARALAKKGDKKPAGEPKPAAAQAAPVQQDPAPAKPAARPAQEEQAPPVNPPATSAPTRLVPEPAAQEPVVPKAPPVDPPAGLVPRPAQQTTNAPASAEKPAPATQPDLSDEEKLAKLRGLWRDAMADRRVPPGTSNFIRDAKGKTSVVDGDLHFDFPTQEVANRFIDEGRSGGLETVFSEMLKKQLTVHVGVIGAPKETVRESSDDTEGDSRERVVTSTTAPTDHSAQSRFDDGQSGAPTSAPSPSPASNDPDSDGGAHGSNDSAEIASPVAPVPQPTAVTSGGSGPANTSASADTGGRDSSQRERPMSAIERARARSAESRGSAPSPADARNVPPDDWGYPEPTPPDDDEYGEIPAGLPSDLPDIVMEDFPAPPPADMPPFPAPPPRNAPSTGGPAFGASSGGSFSKLAENRGTVVPEEEKLDVEHEEELVSDDDPLALEAEGIGLQVVIEMFGGKVIEEVEEDRDV